MECNMKKTDGCGRDRLKEGRAAIFENGVCKICVPVFGRNREELLASAQEALASPADIFEWRCDYADDEDMSTDEYIGRLQAQWEQLSKVLSDRPVLVTHRSKREGGEGRSDASSYGRIIEWASHTGADLLDVELTSLRELEGLLTEKASENHVGEKEGVSKEDITACEIIRGLKDRMQVVMSAHYFHCTPGEEEMFSFLEKMERLGADVAKLAVIPSDREDVVKLLSASAKEASASGQLSAEAVARIRECL